MVSVVLGGFALNVKGVQQSETWVMNETVSINYNMTFTINFVSNDTYYSSFKISMVGLPPNSYYVLFYGSTQAYTGSLNAWYNVAYRTITFETAPTGDLLTWLQVNAEKIDEELIGYRPLVDSDIGKEFGVDLDNKIYFNLEPSFDGYDENAVLIDWVITEGSYVFELKGDEEMHKWNYVWGCEYYFRGGFLGDDEVPVVEIRFDEIMHTTTFFYYIESYTLPNLSYINEIYYGYAKDLILVKDLSLTDEEIAYINGYEDGKKDYGGFVDGQWLTAEDYAFWEYNRGLSESIDVFDVLIGGIFGSLTAFGNIEILPGLKIFYIVGIFVVFGVVGFIIQKKFGGDD